MRDDGKGAPPFDLLAHIGHKDFLLYTSVILWIIYTLLLLYIQRRLWQEGIPQNPAVLAKKAACKGCPDFVQGLLEFFS
ncbi:hypothetical protein EVA_15669 [gut metagenome]|uniref:Uncharacterized protein n=1 Tax=gut metagenome TaxID=749906 RepID=J9G9U4_9ZZZZ